MRLPDPFLTGFCLSAAATLIAAAVMSWVRGRQAWRAGAIDEALLVWSAGVMLVVLAGIAAGLPFLGYSR